MTTKARLEEMSVRDLRAKAKAAGLSGYSRMKKPELIRLLMAEGKTATKKSAAKKIKKQPMVADVRRREKAPDKYFQFSEAQEQTPEGDTYEYPRVTDLPERYEADALTLLVRDEKAMFAIWELGGEMIGRAREAFASEDEWRRRRMIFRLFRVGSGPREMVGQYDVFGETGRYHLFTPRPDCDYYCILGYLKDDGAFVDLMRSNTVHAPRISPVKAAPQWVTADKKKTGFVVRDVTPPKGWPVKPLEPGAMPGSAPFTPGSSNDNLWVRPAEEEEND